MLTRLVALVALVAALPPLLAVASACGLSGCTASADDGSSAADLGADLRRRDAGVPDAGAAGHDAGSGEAGDAGATDDDACDQATFLFTDGSATEVHVTGTFTNPPWADADSGALAMTRYEGGVFALTARFTRRAHHQYRFIVDRQPTWYADPLNPERVDDGTGQGVNSVVNHWRSFLYFTSATDGPVGVTGNFLAPAWSQPGFVLTFGQDDSGNTGYFGAAQLPSGTSLYKFFDVHDASWHADPYNPETVGDAFGGQNSVAHVCHD
jgi:hypothetical protein